MAKNDDNAVETTPGETFTPEATVGMEEAPRKRARKLGSDGEGEEGYEGEAEERRADTSNKGHVPLSSGKGGSYTMRNGRREKRGD